MSLPYSSCSSSIATVNGPEQHWNSNTPPTPSLKDLSGFKQAPVAMETDRNSMLSNKQLIELLDSCDLENKISNVRVRQPRGGQVYVFNLDDIEFDYRCDNHMWRNNGSKEFPKNEPQFVKTYYTSSKPNVDKKQISTRNFRKNIYRPLNRNHNMIIVHYLGSEDEFIMRPHGNSKTAKLNFVRTLEKASSTLNEMKNIVGLTSPSTVLRSLTSSDVRGDDQGVLNDDTSAAQSLKELNSQEQPILAMEIDINSMLSNEKLMELLDSSELENRISNVKVSKPRGGQVYVFNIDVIDFDYRLDNYIWKNNGSKKYPKNEPQFVKTYYTCSTPNDDKMQLSTGNFRKNTYKPLHRNQNLIIVHYLGSEDEFIMSPHGNVLNSDMQSLKELNGQDQPLLAMETDINSMLSIKQLMKLLDTSELENRISNVRVNKPRGGQVYIFNKDVIEFDYKWDNHMWRNNGSKEFPKSEPEFVKTYYTCSTPNNDKKQMGSRNFRKNTYSPLKRNQNLIIVHYLGSEDEFIIRPRRNVRTGNKLDDKKNLGEMSIARKILESKGVCHVPDMECFMVKDSKGYCYSVKLFPKEICHCPSTGQCHHIIAAKLSIGMVVNEAKPKINPRQRKKNSKKRQRSPVKKSRRKVRRKCDNPSVESICPQDLVDTDFKDNDQCTSIPASDTIDNSLQEPCNIEPIIHIVEDSSGMETRVAESDGSRSESDPLMLRDSDS